ncbi:MAG TPA: hypothetical protein PK264_17050 [Hyphomicrobiaceae bacterium]|nr:hypothetical protein [Hyphomicrobiaceae bacterium]
MTLSKQGWGLALVAAIAMVSTVEEAAALPPGQHHCGPSKQISRATSSDGKWCVTKFSTPVCRRDPRTGKDVLIGTETKTQKEEGACSASSRPTRPFKPVAPPHLRPVRPPVFARRGARA